MDPAEKTEKSNELIRMSKYSSSTSDIDQLCQLIDESTFGFSNVSPSKFRSVPSSQVKTFRSSRLKRLNHSKLKCPDEFEEISSSSDHEENSLPFRPSRRRTFSMRSSYSSSLIHRFRSLTTNRSSSSRSSHLRSFPSRHSTSTISLYRTESTLPSIHEEDLHSTSSPFIDPRRTTGNACNVEELAAYLDHFLYLPKSLSGAAELMYT